MTNQASEFILNADGSVYHLNLLPEDIASTIITVGDPYRVTEVSKHFDRIDVKKAKREFVTHTGYIGAHQLTVLSTGIGAGNIDIVINELDALVNMNRSTGLPMDELTTLHLIRLGTSGSIHPEVGVDSVLISGAGIGLDGVMQFYGDSSEPTFSTHLQEAGLSTLPHYIARCGRCPFDQPTGWHEGITLSSPGFYAPQGRSLRLPCAVQLPLDTLYMYESDGLPITNMEMETAPIFALSRHLGHEATSINCILANRHEKRFSTDPDGHVRRTIEELLALLTA